ncbi:indoleamine 2,3-dioxyganese b [Moniliophthora roreri MCA 2997]|uniref:Indoleamine 2,3-dioxyganese b n=1 Tax=Moniliophthora roreri (strain MCA 2997) TaxID=1381753 RepID=V2WX99_MONRO|nr:indoleamine 2,3-dioxyganese b [Moniliophthora roreri MCA 2997]
MLLSIKKAYDPGPFYNFVRPWLGGGTWVFEGDETHTHTHTLVESSAAQSPLVQTLDVFPDTSSSPDRTTKSKDFPRGMRTYMSRSHREFLECLRNGGRGDKLRSESVGEAYKKAVDVLKQFRDAHIVMVTLFVVGPARKEGIKGTAGTYRNGVGMENVAMDCHAGRFDYRGS